MKLSKDEIMEAVWKKKPEENPPTPIKPEEPLLAPQKPKMTLKRSGNKVKLTWKKVKDADGYEISMKTGKGKYKIIARKGKAARSYRKTVKSKKTLFFRMRAYRKAPDGKLYGKYSAVKKVKIKS